MTPDVSEDVFDYDMSNIGTETNTTMYFYFRSNSTGNNVKIADASATFNSSNLGIVYEVYGGFDNQDEVCAGLANRTLSPVTTGSGTGSFNITTNVTADKFYVVKLVINGRKGHLVVNVVQSVLSRLWAEVQCQDCMTGFKPPYGTYILSAWVKDANALATTTSFSRPSIVFHDGVLADVSCTPSGDIIEGWQRIEKEVEISISSTDVSINLVCGGGAECYFDDIRFYPKDGSMVTYVYDPETYRLVAEMDERNYAKIYEYSEDGKLIRIKKETERGIMTIQETRENNSGR